MKERIALILLLWCGVALVAEAEGVLPTDPCLRHGRLKNGMEYYVRHNEVPRGAASFCFVQKVGSLVESESQRGMAHFIEHCCFDGTKNFPGSAMSDYLMRLGMKSGEGFNASTSIDNTIYSIKNVPLTSGGVVDTCLLMVHDWAGGLEISSGTVKKEKKVIREEWRGSNNRQMRMYDAVLPRVYGESRYGARLPMGRMERVESFTAELLQGYYREWYRPDLQAIVVVGDIDADLVVKRIEVLFADIEPRGEAAGKREFEVFDNREPIVAVASDKEQSMVTMMMWAKNENIADAEKERESYLKRVYARAMVGYMMSDRLNEARVNEERAIVRVSAEQDKFLMSDVKSAFKSVVTARKESWREALAATYRELLRAKRHGFTEVEVARIVRDYEASFRNRMREADSKKNSAYVSDYVENFLHGEPMMSEEEDCSRCLEMLKEMTAEYINQTVDTLMGDENWVVAAFCPETKGGRTVTEAEVKQVMRQVEAEEIEPYREKAAEERAMDFAPEPGRVVEEKEGPYGSKEYRLQNGARVVVKQTDLKHGEIVMAASSAGGLSVVDEGDLRNAQYMGSIVPRGGYRGMSPSEIARAMTGKMAKVQVFVNELQERVTGRCASEDFESMMKLTYMKMAEPNHVPEVMEEFRKSIKAEIAGGERDADKAFADTVSRYMFGTNPRVAKTTMEEADAMDYERVMKIYEERFGNAADFTFVFVGNIDVGTCLPLIERYIGGLPGDESKRETIRDNGVYVVPGERKIVMKKEDGGTPRAVVEINMAARMEYSMERQLMADMTGELLQTRLTEQMRENEGGTYDVSADCNISQYPQGEAILTVYFETSPLSRQKLTRLVGRVLGEVGEKGFSAEEVENVKRFLMRFDKDSRESNQYWLNAIDDYYWRKMDMVSDYERTLEGIDGEKVRAFVNELLRSGNRVEAVMEEK